MDSKKVRKLLRDVRDGRRDVDEAAEKLAAFGTGELGFARIDHHRPLRRGFAEAVLGEGKTPEQILKIVEHMAERRSTVLVTRLAAPVGEELAKRHPKGEYDALSRTFLLHGTPRKRLKKGLVIVSAGTADQPVAQEAAVSAEAFGLESERIFDVGVAGLHRLLGHVDVLRKAKVLVVVAGMEGALPSVVAGLVEAPVIGVPTSVGYGVAAGGQTALMGMLTSCAEGLTVVNIDNGFGAACAARAILTARGGRS